MTVGIANDDCLECGCPYERHRKRGIYRPCKCGECDDYTADDRDAYEEDELYAF